MTRIFGSLILLVLAVVGSTAAYAQDQKPVGAPPAKNDALAPPDTRGQLLKQLGLTRQQAMALRRLNADRKFAMDAAQAKLRQANRALDQAIYADQINEADVQARLKDAHEAQAEVVRIRTMNELAVRRLLTPEQLGRFRQMRQRFEEARQKVGKPNPMNRPANGPMRQMVKQSGAKPLR
jgi:Spy/CpxP family protein refolding chaperone